MVDNKYFVPVEFNVEIKRQVQVVVETVKYVKPQSELKITAAPIIVKKTQPTTQPIVVSQQSTLAAKFKHRS